jgi:hypothetical protein
MSHNAALRRALAELRRGRPEPAPKTKAEKKPAEEKAAESADYTDNAPSTKEF